MNKTPTPIGTEPRDEGRMIKKRRETRARLLHAAYIVMSAEGIDAAKIKDITDAADIGFGTFYNYFQSKDDLAVRVLDCIINDFGRRNVKATAGLGRKDPAQVMPVSIRLVLREVMTDPLWLWWAHRPDLLFDRMCLGFAPFGTRDMREAVRKGIFEVADDDIDAVWRQSVWLMVGGIHDVVVGEAPPDSEMLVVESIMRMMGVAPDRARETARSALPIYPARHIDWKFELEGK